MQDFPSNSKMAREPEPEQLKQVTSAESVRRKRGLGRQFKEAFVVGTGRDAMTYMIEDVVVPAIRDTLTEALQGGIDRLINGDRPGRSRASRVPYSNPASGSHVNYNGILSSSPKPPPARTMSRRSRARHNFDDIVISSLNEANEVIDRLFDVLARYGQVQVAQLYALTGIEPSHVDQKWGWTNLKGAKAVRLRNGTFLLDLPAPEELR